MISGFIYCVSKFYSWEHSRVSLQGISRYSYRGEFSCLFDAKTCDRPTWSSGCDFLQFLISTEIIVWIISNWIMLQRSSECNHYNFFTFTTYPVFTWFILCTTTTTVSVQQILAFARTSSVAISFSLRAAQTLAATALRCFLNDKSSIFGLWLQKQRKDAHLKQVISTYGRICHGGQHKTWSIWERPTSMCNSWDCGFNEMQFHHLNGSYNSWELSGSLP